MPTYTYFVYTADALDVSGGTISLAQDFNAADDRRVIEITDNDNSLQGDFTNDETGIDATQTGTVYESDGQTLATFGGGTTYVDDRIYADQQFILTGTDGSQIVVYQMEIDGQVVGYLPTSPLDPDIDYSYETLNVISDSEILGNWYYYWYYYNLIGEDETDPTPYVDEDGNPLIEGAVVCFTPDSRVVTPEGKRRIGDLQVGDMVKTKDRGFQPLRWMYRRRLSRAQLAARPELSPVVIERGAFGPDCPRRRMRVSPQHRILVQDHRAELFFGEAATLAPAKGLIDGRTVWQDTDADGVDYIHLLLDRHEVIEADGLYSESYYPGDWSLEGLTAPARQEIFTLFPEIAANPAAYGPAAYPALSVREAALLCA